MAPLRLLGASLWAAAVLACWLSAAPAYCQGGGGGIAGPGAAMNKLAPKPVRDKTPQYGPSGPQLLITDVHVTGNVNVSENAVFSLIKTRSGRTYDPEQVQSDVRSLATSGRFRDVKTFTENTPEGIAITFQVFERATIANEPKFIGNRVISDKALKKQITLKKGDPINSYALEEARRKLEEYYSSQGFPNAEVTIYEGNRPEDTAVTFLVGEGELQRVSSTEFVGNSIATDARLKTFIQSKPGYFWYIGGKVDLHKIDEDVDRLTAYYRRLGFFRARIGREVDIDESGKWLKLKFVIDEGPRYEIRNISFAGNTKYDSEQLAGILQLKQGDVFDADKLHKDENAIRDNYGSQGHVFADIKADLRFLEEPGKMDLVYQVNEGDVYRVGKIDVKINGESSHTRRTVVLNRISLRPGDIVDVREVRASERRLKASQLFKTEPQSGIEPKIVVKPPELSQIEEAVASDPNRANSGTARGQSPEGAELHLVRRPVYPPTATLEIEIDAADCDILERLPPTAESP